MFLSSGPPPRRDARKAILGAAENARGGIDQGIDEARSEGGDCGGQLSLPPERIDEVSNEEYFHLFFFCRGVGGG